MHAGAQQQTRVLVRVWQLEHGTTRTTCASRPGMCFAD